MIHTLDAHIALDGVKINKQIARWPVQSPPDDWARIRASWVRFHNRERCDQGGAPLHVLAEIETV